MTQRFRNTDPFTSRLAAESVEGKIRASQQEALTLFRIHGPMTLDQAVEAYNRAGFKLAQTPSGLRTRIKELREKGKLEVLGTVKVPGKRTAVMRVGIPQDSEGAGRE